MGRTFQQWVSSQRAEGHSADDIKAGFKAHFGDDLDAFDADADYDAYKASKRAPAIPAAPSAPPAETVKQTTEQLPEWLSGKAKVAAAPAPPLSKAAAAAPREEPVRARFPDERASVVEQTVTEIPQRLEAEGLEISWPIDKDPLGKLYAAGLGVAKQVAGPESKIGKSVDFLFGMGKGAQRANEALRERGLDGMTEADLTPIKAREALQGIEKAPLVQSPVRITPMGGLTGYGADVARAMESSEKRRQERTVTDEGVLGHTLVPAYRFTRNVATGLGELAMGLASLANEFAGVTVVPKGTTEGDIGFAMGEAAAVQMPAQWLDTVRGLGDLSGSNSLLADPVNTFVDVIDPGLRQMARIPGAAAKATKLRTTFRDRVLRPMVRDRLEKWARGQTPDPSLPALTDDIIAAGERMVTEGVMMGDPRMTAIAEDIIYGGSETESALQNITELAARQMEQGAVKPVRPELEPVQVAIRPKPDERAMAAAQKRVEKAQTEAGQVGGRADAAAQLAAEARELQKEQGVLQRKAAVRERGVAEVALPNELARKSREQLRKARAAVQEAASAGHADFVQAGFVGIRKTLQNIAKTEGVEAALDTLRYTLQEDLPEGVKRVSDEAVAALADAIFQRKSAPKDVLSGMARQRAATGATAAIQLAEGAKALDAAPTAGMARELAGMERGAARKAERAAERVAEAEATTGVRPEVEAGTVYLPPGAADDGRMVIDEATGGYALDPANPQMAAARAKSAALQEALDAGYKPDAVAPAAELARAGLPEGMTVEEAGRRFAEYLIGRNKDDAPDLMTARLEALGVDRAAARQAADYFLAGVELRNQVRRIEQEFAPVIRRPSPEVKQAEVGPGGRVIPLPESGREGVRQALAGEQAEAGPAREADKEWRRMQDAVLEDQPPAPTTTTSPIFNEAAREAGELLRERAYVPDGRVPGEQTSRAPTPRDASALDAFVDNAKDYAKRLTVERFQQRLQESLEPDTAQLLRSKDQQAEIMRMVRARATAAGLTPREVARISSDFARILADPANHSAISKNRFTELKLPSGEVLFGRKDIADLQAQLSPKVLAKRQAEVARVVAGDHASAARVYQQLQSLNNEVNRFRKDATGKPIDSTMQEGPGYAVELARRVLAKGEAPPLAMPFSGETVASYLVGNADEIAKAIGVPPERVVKLADWLGRFRPVEKDSSLQALVDGTWRNTLRSTEPSPSMVNVHMVPGLQEALGAQLFVENAAATLRPFPRLVQQLGQRAKKSLVALSAKTLVNNDLSNIIQDAIHWGDPLHVVNAPVSAIRFKQYLDGDHGPLTPQQLRKYKGLNRTNMVQGAQVSRDIGETRLWEAFKEAFPGPASVAERADAKTGFRASQWLRKGQTVEDLQADAYTKLGDVPFRLASAERVYDNTEGLVGMLGTGEHIVVPVTTTGTKTVRVQRLDGDRVRLTVEGGPRAQRTGRNVALDSQELADVLAQYANVVQERRYFDYSRTGNMGKMLRGGPLSLLSGVFSWFFKAANPRFVGEILGGPEYLRTNSPRVEAFQRQQRAAVSMRRAVLNLAAQTSMQGQEGLEDLRRMAGWNDAVLGAVIAAGTDPWAVEVRNLEPLMFTQPLQTMLSLGEKVASSMRFYNVMDDPDAVNAILNPDEAALTDAVATEAKVLAEEVGRPLTQTERDRIERVARGRVQQRRSDFIRYATGRQFSVKQALSLVGLSGGPLLSIMQRMQAAEDGGRPFGAEDAIREFSKQMFGANLMQVADVGAGALGNLGSDAAARWSTYGGDYAKTGFRGGEGGGGDAAGFLRWAIRQTVGLGWRTVDITGGENPATGKQTMGRIKVYLSNVKGQLDKNLVRPAEKMANAAAARFQADPSPENERRADEATRLYNVARETVKEEIGRMEQQLNDQAATLRDRARAGSPQTAPALQPTVKPVP